MNKRVLVTGSIEGMVGSHLVKYLEPNYDINEFRGDTRDFLDWMQYNKYSFDYVIHLAAFAGVRPSFDDPEKYYLNNVGSMHHALKFTKSQKAKFIYASSSNAYEWWGNPYAATKKMNEVQAMESASELPSVGMRFHTIWPGRDDMLFRKLQRGEVSYINTNHYRDFVHVDDVVRAIEVIMENFDYLTEIHNCAILDIGTGHATPVEQVAKIFDFDGEYRSDNPVGERVHTKADIEWLLSLGWTPRYNILNKEHHYENRDG